MNELQDIIKFIDSPAFNILSQESQIEILMKEHQLIKSSNNANFDDVIDMLKQLNRNKTGNSLAPHKPVMLLAIIILIENGHINCTRVELDQDLKDTFKNTWKQYVPEECTFACQYRNPFTYMDKSFWKLESSGNSAVLSDSIYYAFNNDNAKSIIKQILIDMIINDSVSHSDTKGDSSFISKAAENILSLLPAVAMSFVKMIG